MNKVVEFIVNVIPGLRQFKEKEAFKGSIYLGIFLVFLVGCGEYIIKGIRGFITLGDVRGQDDSLFLLAHGTLALMLLVGAIIALRIMYTSNKRLDKHNQKTKFLDKNLPYILLALPTLLVVLFVLFPVLMTVFFSFTDYNLYTSPPQNLFNWVGLQNYLAIFTEERWSGTFFDVFSWTLIWTLATSFGSIVIGVLLGVVANQSDIKGKKFFRTIYILPWAVPSFISVMVFSGMFAPGGQIDLQVIPFLNKIIPFLEIPTGVWTTELWYTRLIVILIQIWVGFPFIFLTVTGVLQSISTDFYEAATIDGATRYKQFKYITLPLILKATLPILITQFTFNFNNFSIIYLYNEGGPAVDASKNAQGTDILISWIYKLTTDSPTKDYNMAAAVTLITSAIVIIVSLYSMKRAKTFKDEE